MKPVDQTGHFCTKTGKRFLPLSLAFSVLFFCALFLLDFPKPGLDDLFFTGAALNLAAGGDFSNPLLVRQQFPSHFYFVHPPTYSYALACWLKMFGISAAAMIGFQLLSYLLVCAAMIALLRRHQAAAVWEWLVPLGVAASFLPEGLRPEAFSVAMTLCGFALIECFSARAWHLFAGFFLMILGGSIAERLTFFSAALLVAAFVDLRKRGVPLSRSIWLAGLALLIAVAILLDLIGFKAAEFWRTYHFHAVGRIGGEGASISGFLRSVSIIQWPLILLWLTLLPCLPRLRNQELARTAVFLTGGLLVSVLIGALFNSEICYVILMLLFISAAAMKQFSKKWARLLPLVVAAGLLIANSRNFIYAAGIVAGKIKADAGDRLAAARALAATAEHPVLIDSETARYVFDYRLPRGVLDWSFAAQFPGALATDDALRPGDIYLVGPDSVDWLNLKTHLNLQLPRWQPLGPNKSFHEYPQRVYMIRPADCAGRRGAN